MIKKCCYTTLPPEGIHRPRVLWEITSKCNFGCKFCSLQYPLFRDLDTEQCFRTIKILKSFGIWEILLAGREPLLRTDIFQIINKIEKAGISVAISTNGSFLEKLEECLLRFSNIRAVNLSLDSSLETIHDQLRGFNGSFLKITQFLNKCQFGKKVKVNITVTPLNLAQVENTVIFLLKLGVSFISISPVSLIGNRNFKGDTILDSYQLQELMEKYETLTKAFPDRKIHLILPNQCGLSNNELCYAGEKLIAILPDGSVAPCNILAHLSSKHIIGNILEKNVAQIWKKSARSVSSRNLILKRS